MARQHAFEDVIRISRLPIKRKAIENPKGALSRLWRKPDQIIQPYRFGADASKATCLWLENLPPLKVDPVWRKLGRLVAEFYYGDDYTQDAKPKVAERWANQTDSGQSNATPEDDRWQKRSETFPQISRQFAKQWGCL